MDFSLFLLSCLSLHYQKRKKVRKRNSECGKEENLLGEQKENAFGFVEGEASVIDGCSLGESFVKEKGMFF